MLARKLTKRSSFLGAYIAAPLAALVASSCSSAPGPTGTGGASGTSSHASTSSSGSPTTTSSGSVTASSTSSGASTSGASSSGATSGSSSSSGSVNVARKQVTITGTIDRTFVTSTHMFATTEMQVAGEPLAESMGRALAGYSRDFPTPNVYFTPVGDVIPDTKVTCEVDGGVPEAMYNANYASCPVPSDLVGFATAVESYEYSKQPMNNLAFEGGMGTSYIYGPLVNPSGVTGSQALALAIPRLYKFAQNSNAAPQPGVVWPPVGGNGSTFVFKVDGTDPTNRLGWPGFWPTMHPYSQFDPTILPAQTFAETCSISSDDDPNATGNILNLDYECDYNSLHLPNRAAQITPTITPGSQGWADWKYGLWVLNYLQSMHDVNQFAVVAVPAGQLSQVGVQGNTVVANDGNTPPTNGVPGTYLGSSDIEGYQAAVMIDEIDNAAEHWLTALTTTDGVTLTGFGSQGDGGTDPAILAALQYNYTSPLQWFPGAINVTEAPDTASGYPIPSSYAITDSGSHLFDQIGLIGAYATFFALTDQSNSNVGGSQPVQAYFDGDPFPVQNQVANGSATLHDRALAMLRVSLINLDRLHRDPTTNLLVDDVTFVGNTPTRGATIATSSVAYSIVGLRTMRRAIGSQLQLYSNFTPDTCTAGTETVLDGKNGNLPLTGAPGADGGAPVYVSDRLQALIDNEAQLLLNDLTTASGDAYAGWNVQTSAPTSTTPDLDSYTAAIRGLLSAYLATGTTAYRDRAVAVFNQMDATLYDPAGLIYVETPGAQSVTYTPMRFGMLEAALRDLYETVGNTPGEAAFGSKLQNRIARLIKLVLNGWDDGGNPDGGIADGFVEWPNECANQGVAPGFADGGIIGLGGLQMAERALSGEIGPVCDSVTLGQCQDAGQGSGWQQYTPDRQHNCVPEIGAAQLPSALANQVTFTIGN